MQEEIEIKQRVSDTDEREVEDDHQGEQREAAVVLQRLAIFQADVDDAGHHHGEHEQDAAE